MNHRIRIPCLLLLCGAPFLWTQEPVEPPSQGLTQLTAHSPVEDQDRQPPDPVLKPNQLETLRNFEPPANEEYRLGKGDEITVDFTGRPEIQAKIVVGPDGRISLPLAGDMKVAELTRAETARMIETALEPYYSNLACQVTVTKYTSNRILVMGAVDHPGIFTFDGVPTLLEALAHSLETGPDKIGKTPERCAVYRGQNQVVWVQLKELIEAGNPLADLRLRRDDMIYVPAMAERFVSVLGEVQHPGAVQLTLHSTLVDVLAAVGGVTGKAGNKPHIQIVDPAAGTSRIISFNDLLTPTKSNEIVLKPGQIIFVPQSGLFRATYVLERLSPLLTMGSMAYMGAHL